uniref:Uncharacterized protein n=1 Tax=Octopus bimaculoides TaxID=37653 RepID=A0A0L8GNA1_OCTBM
MYGFNINNMLLNSISGTTKIYKFVDSIPNSAEVVSYPVEFLNYLEPLGLPPHRRHLKVTIIRLLPSLAQPRLCNGTKLVLKKELTLHLIQATVLTRSTGDIFMPRIPLIASNIEIESYLFLCKGL